MSLQPSFCRYMSARNVCKNSRCVWVHAGRTRYRRACAFVFRWLRGHGGGSFSLSTLMFGLQRWVFDVDAHGRYMDVVRPLCARCTFSVTVVVRSLGGRFPTLVKFMVDVRSMYGRCAADVRSLCSCCTASYGASPVVSGRCALLRKPILVRWSPDVLSVLRTTAIRPYNSIISIDLQISVRCTVTVPWPCKDHGVPGAFVIRIQPTFLFTYFGFIDSLCVIIGVLI